MVGPPQVVVTVDTANTPQSIWMIPCQENSFFSQETEQSVPLEERNSQPLGGSQ